MSGFGGFGGFGQQNQQQQQQQQNTGFGGGGFGSTAAPSTGFGSTGTTAFGSTSTTTGGGLFGGGGGTTGGFGGSSGGFGSSGGAFGAKPGGFGTTTTTTGSSLFGATATAPSTGFGGFGSTPAATSTPFGGAASSSGGLFGSQKPAFGASGTGTAFGTPQASSPFGGTTTSAFGAPPSTALGGATGECQGTGSVPFQPFIEKEPNSTNNQQNSFQSISFQAPYAKFSPEELRLADYSQGRRYGNSNGQVGAFGASNFGGFNSTSTAGGFGTPAATTGSSLFGGAASTGFGATQPAQTGGFGSAATASGGGLFGAPKPAGGLFGSTPAQPSGGLFGSAGTGSTGFGGAATTGGFGQPAAQGAGTSLFGNAATANKPFSFGPSQPATGSAFGGAAAATTGFGTGGGGLFGSTGQQQQQTGGFGQQQPAATGGFGGFGGAQQQTGTSSLFGGANQPKPAGGLFGSTPAAASTGGGLFGNTQQPAANSNPFGGSNNNQGGSSLFGAPKPATGGLFGSTPANAQPNTGGGLFGGSFGNTQPQNQGQQQNTGGLFGGLNNNNQAKPSLFGSSTQQAGGGLFGASGTQQQGGPFGSTNNQPQQQQPQNSLFGGNSMFGSQQGQQTPQTLTTTISDTSAYGSSQMFSGLATQVNNPGPIATPLSGNATKQKRIAAIPITRLSSSSTTRFITPQKNRSFGFSYSGFNSPASTSSVVSTPGTLNNSTLGSYGGFTRSLGKSVSTSSLRNSFSAQENILAPGAFSNSAGPRQYGSAGSLKKLNIHRNLRADLFSPPTTQPSQPLPTSGGSILKKRVSFGDVHANGNPSPLKNAFTNGSPSSEELGLLRPRSNVNGAKSSEPSAQPEMEQTKGKELAIVHEEGHNTPAAADVPTIEVPDSETAGYYMKPSRQEIDNMTHTQRQRVANFVVGRHGLGEVRFIPPVDLTTVQLDDIINKIVVIKPRSATVYVDNKTKPVVGKGLNVPSILTLYNSWPRNARTGKIDKSPERLRKHMNKLSRVPDTTFISFDVEKATWVFRVEHFTTYGCPDDDEEEVSEFGQSTLSQPPDTPTPKTRTPGSRNMEYSFATTSPGTGTDSEPDDTFDFRRKKVFPGAFDDQQLDLLDNEMDADFDGQESQSFLDERSVGSQSERGVEEPMDQDYLSQDGSVSILDQEMAGSYPEAGNTAEQDENSQDDEEMGNGGETPGAILRARMRAAKFSETPSKKFMADNDWTNALLTTVSPKKQDRALLKSMIDINGDNTKADATPYVTRRVISDGHGFANSIDLMNSLFGQTRSPQKIAKVPTKRKDLPWPYAKRSKVGNDENTMSEVDRAFHYSMKPSWGPDGTLVYAAPQASKSFGRSSIRARERDGLLSIQKGSVISQYRDIKFAKFSNESAGEVLQKQKTLTWIIEGDGIPSARLPDNFLFSDFLDSRTSRDPATAHEKLVWQLASILFDEVKVPDSLKNLPKIDSRLRKDNLSAFWQKLVDDASTKHVALARSFEEKAIASLSGRKIADACEHLMDGEDYYLATLVSLLGVKDDMRKDMREQLKFWQDSHLISEFSQPIRALYELLAGNVCVCDGSKGAPEDRIDSFIISKRFGLDWRQAFGFRLWYGIRSKDSIDAAVEGYAHDLSQKKETARPHSWYVEQKVPKLWDDDELQEREDLLWGLLKLYTFEEADLESILRPENSQLSPLDMRLTWQLGQALISSGVITYGEDGNEKADQTTLSFASQLTNEGSWLDAVFVLLHLDSDAARSKLLQRHLAQHAKLIGSEESQNFKTLVNTYKIPPTWVWEAKALYMRSVEKDSQGEVVCLIKAGSFNEAHRTFTRDVAPVNVIERDYNALRFLLDGFQGQESTISEWHLGGEIYHDFLELLEHEEKSIAVDQAVLNRLLVSLPAVIADARHASFLETVAIETMSAVVADNVTALNKRGEDSELKKILRLPLTEDKHLKHTVELSLGYYRGIMASGR